jgi:glycosyltransferase involved in cell wall biosynthesis
VSFGNVTENVMESAAASMAEGTTGSSAENLTASARLSLVIPARNEAVNLRKLLPELLRLLPAAEIIVVNDASRDDTVVLCSGLGVKVVTHQYQKGNGASIKTGARHATRELVVFLDGDGQHKPADILRLLEKHAEGYDMVVGARSAATQASMGRLVANTLYNRLSSWISNQDILDLTSGFRIVNRLKFLQFLYLLPNGFSYPTTITMAFFRAGYSVAYVDIEAGRREGKSHISLMKDGIRFFLIIFKIGTLYSPLKIFLPIAFGFFSTGILYYLYTFFRFHTFTNMSAVLFMTAIIVFLIGLVSEQVTTLIYKDSE